MAQWICLCLHTLSSVASDSNPELCQLFILNFIYSICSNYLFVILNCENKQKFESKHGQILKIDTFSHSNIICLNSAHRFLTPFVSYLSFLVLFWQYLYPAPFSVVPTLPFSKIMFNIKSEEKQQSRCHLGTSSSRLMEHYRRSGRSSYQIVVQWIYLLLPSYIGR